MEDQDTKVIAEVITKTVTPEEKKSVWNSLEVIKIIIGALTPLLIAGFGWYATQQATEREQARIAREEAKAKTDAIANVAGKLSAATESFAFDFEETMTIMNGGGSFKYKAFETFQTKYSAFAAKINEDMIALQPLISSGPKWHAIKKNFDIYILGTSGRLFRCIQSSATDQPLAGECNFVRDGTLLHTCAPYFGEAIRLHELLPLKVPNDVLQMCAQNNELFVLDPASIGAPPIPTSPPPAFH